MLLSNSRPSDPVVWDLFLFTTLFVLYFLALFVKPTSYRRVIFVLAAGLVAYLMRSTRRADSTPLRGSTIASVTVPVLFAMSDFVFLTEAQRELRRKGQKVRADRMKWRSRLGWAFALFSSPRGVGWEHEPSHVIGPLPRSISKTRWSFIKAQVIRLGVYAVMLELLRCHDHWNPCYAKDGPSIMAFGWMWRAFSMSSWAMQTYIQIDRLYWIVGMVSVLAGVTSPEEWPLFFGGLWDAYTVGRFWGCVALYVSVTR